MMREMVTDEQFGEAVWLLKSLTNGCGQGFRVGFFRPYGAGSSSTFPPMARAVGFILSPLRG
jgi:hypothetical protein